MKLDLSRTSFNQLLAQQITLPELIYQGDASLEGNAVALRTMFGSLDQTDPLFEIVEP